MIQESCCILLYDVTMRGRSHPVGNSIRPKQPPSLRHYSKFLAIGECWNINWRLSERSLFFLQLRLIFQLSDDVLPPSGLLCKIWSASLLIWEQITLLRSSRGRRKQISLYLCSSHVLPLAGRHEREDWIENYCFVTGRLLVGRQEETWALFKVGMMNQLRIRGWGLENLW